MTLHAKPALTAAPQEMLEHGSGIGIMAGQTIHRLTVTRIKGCFPHRMTEGFMSFVTLGTHVLSILQHRRVIGTVSLVTIGTTVPVRMLVQHIIPPRKGISMTTAADAPLILRQQPGTITDMRVMADRTGICSSADSQVAMNDLETGQGLFMATEAESGSGWLPMTTFALTVGKGLMTDLA